MTYQTDEDRKVGAPVARDFFDGPPPVYPRRGATEPIMKKLRTVQMRAFEQIKKEVALATQQEEDSDTETPSCNMAAQLDQEPDQFAIVDRQTPASPREFAIVDAQVPLSPKSGIAEVEEPTSPGGSDERQMSPQMIAATVEATGEETVEDATVALDTVQNDADHGTMVAEVKDEEMMPATEGEEEPQAPILPEAAQPGINPEAWKQSIGELPTSTQPKEEELECGGDADEHRFEVATTVVADHEVTSTVIFGHEVKSTVIESSFAGTAMQEEDLDGVLPDIELLQLSTPGDSTESAATSHEV